MKLSIASLSSLRSHAPADARRPKAHPIEAKPRYAAKLIDLDDDDSPTWMLDTRRPRSPSARV